MSHLRTQWPEERLAEIRKLATLGMSAGQIATVIGGATRNAIVGACTRNGIALNGKAGLRPSTESPPPALPRPKRGTSGKHASDSEAAVASQEARTMPESDEESRPKRQARNEPGRRGNLSAVTGPDSNPPSSPVPSRDIRAEAARIELRLRQRFDGAVEETRIRAIATMQANVQSRVDEGFVADFRPVTIMDLRGDHCRWPHGHPGTEDFRFCGAPKSLGAAYCMHHHAIAYRQSSDREAS